MNWKRAPAPDGNWKRQTLSDICAIQMGQSPAGSDYNSKGDGVPLLNGPTEFGARHPTPRQWTTKPTQFAESGDILLCVRGATTGRKNLADRRYCIGRGLASIRAKEGVADSAFVWFLLDWVTRELLKEASGSTFLNLPGEALKGFEVHIPNLGLQRSIAAMLNDQMTQIALLRDRIRTAFDESRRACESARQKAIDEGLRSCIRTKLGNVLVRLEAGKSVQTLERPPKQGEKAVLKVSAMSWDQFDPTEAKAVPPDYVPPASHLVRKGDLLMSRANTKELVGAAVLVERDYPDLLLSDKSLRLVTDPSKVSPEFLLAALRFPEARAFIEENATGSSSSMRNISQDLIRDIPVPIPDLSIQRELASKLDRISTVRISLIGSFKKQLEATSLLPPAYLRRAFAGSV